MGDAEVSAFAGRVDSLVGRREVPSALPNAEVEALLNDGFALSLALEGKCMRIERLIAQLKPDAEDSEVAPRLRRLPPELRAAQRRLADVRAAMARLQGQREPRA